MLIVILIILASCSKPPVNKTPTSSPPRLLPLPTLHLAFPNSVIARKNTSPTTTILTHTTIAKLATQHWNAHKHIITTALQLSPLLLLQQHQLAMPALALLPTSPATVLLMGLSQLPQVLASSDAESNIAAAGTLSTLVATAWAKYIARSQRTEVDIGPSTVYSVQGGSTDKDKFCIQSLNIQGGITNAEKIIAIQSILKQYKPDAVAISEAGKNCNAEDLKWLNKTMDDHDKDSEFLAANQTDFPYTAVSACTTEEHERGGIVLLLHNKWLHKVVGKPIIDKNGRWISIDIRTPRGRTSLIAAYLPPSPQHSTAAKKAWDDLVKFVISRHIKTKNHLVYLFGDLNASRCDPLQRKNTTNGMCQERLLNTLMDHGGLIDTFPTCNPGIQYRTWGNHNTWSSPDHILISAHARQHATASQTSNVTIKLHGLDHNLLTTYIDINGSGVIPKEDRTHINFDRKRAQEYMSDLGHLPRQRP